MLSFFIKNRSEMKILLICIGLITLQLIFHFYFNITFRGSHSFMEN
jgi:hypothetical protein